MEIWVQIHNIPILFMNRKMAKFLADQIGIAVDVPVETRECRGRFLRVKVQVDVMVPLKKTLKVQMEGSEEAVVLPLRYERLPEFCFVCGRVGHARRDCWEEDAKKKILDGAEVRFGSWMRASSERSATVKQGNGPGESSKEAFSFQKQGMCESGNGRGVGGRVLGVDVDGWRGEISSHMQKGDGIKRSGQVDEKILSSERSEGEYRGDENDRRQQGCRNEVCLNLEEVGEVDRVVGHVGSGDDDGKSKLGRCGGFINKRKQVSRMEVGFDLEEVRGVGRVVGQVGSGEEVGKSKQARCQDEKGGELSGESGPFFQPGMVVGENCITWELNVDKIVKKGGVCGGFSGSGEGGPQQGLKALKLQLGSEAVKSRDTEKEVEEGEVLGGPNASGVVSKGMGKGKGRKGRQGGREVMVTGKSASPSLKLKIAQLRRKRGIKGQNGSPSNCEGARDFKKFSKSPSREVGEISEALVSRQVVQKRRKLAFSGEVGKETRIPDGTQGSEGGVIITAAEPVEQARRQP